MRRIGIVILLMLFFVCIMNCAMAEESCPHENLSAWDVRNVVGTPVVVGQEPYYHRLSAPEAEVLWICDDCRLIYDEYEVAYEVEYIDDHEFIGGGCDFCEKYVDLYTMVGHGTCTVCGLCIDSDHDALSIVVTPDRIDENGIAHFNFEMTNNTEYQLEPWVISVYAKPKTVDEGGRFQYEFMNPELDGYYAAIRDGFQPGEMITGSASIEIDEQWVKNGFAVIFYSDFRHDGRVYRAHGGIEEWADIQDNSAELASEESVLAWLKSVEGTQLDYDNIYPGECVDLIGEYYNFLGVEQTGGNARDYATRPAPVGLIKIPNCEEPKLGDILVYLNGVYGHVAIYESEYVSWHQNLNEIRVVKRWENLHYKNNGLDYWGVIRPNLGREGDEGVYSLSVTPEVLDFGIVYFGQQNHTHPVSRLMTIKNTGNQTVKLNTEAGAVNFKFNYAKEMLSPGEETEVWITPLANLEPRVHDQSVFVSGSDMNTSNSAFASLTVKLTVNAVPEIPDEIQCPVCEGENVTINNTYYQLYEGEWADNGDGTHSGMTVLSGWVYCYDCQDGFEIELTEPAMYVGRHEYEDGYCWDCDFYAIECEHDYDDYELVDSKTILAGRSTYLDEGFHLSLYTSILRYVCTICGEEYIESYPMEGEEAHHYNEIGFCACGKIGEPTNCEHLNWEERDFEYNVRYSDITATEHTKTADLYSGRWCLDCETYRTRILWEPDAETAERHVFEDGICICGYEGGCVEHLYVGGVCVSCGEHYLNGISMIYSLPAGTSEIREEAFIGVPVEAVLVSDGCRIIEARAFAQCVNLKSITMPASVERIADDAFEGCEEMMIFAPADSYAQAYAQEHGYAWFEY